MRSARRARARRRRAAGSRLALKVERDENDQRKEPTISEKVALAEAIAERLQGRVGNPELHANSGNISGIERGDTRDIAAAKAGLGSGKTCNHPRAARSSNHPLTTGAALAHDEHVTETEVAGIGTPE